MYERDSSRFTGQIAGLLRDRRAARAKAAVLSNVAINELSVIMRKGKDGSEWAPRNPEARILGLKGGAGGEREVTVGDIVRAAREKAANPVPQTMMSPKPSMQQAVAATAINTATPGSASVLGYLHASSANKLAAIAEATKE